jgi:hypothetical protein
VTTEGVPPPVDVYIDDGRSGEYAPHLDNFWETSEIWNRLTPDPGAGPTDHATPILSVPNYVFVRVKNRGSQNATNVVVRGFHCKPSAGLVWPDDWQAMTTAQITVPGGIAASATVTVGPFEWTPEVEGHECLLMDVSASGDVSNADPSSGLPSAAGPTPHWRLVPFDNNIAQRNVAPVPGGGGGLNLATAFDGRRFSVNNPYERTARVALRAELPEFLHKKGWDVRFPSAGGAAFTLGPKASREIVMTLVRGEEFAAHELEQAGGQALIRIQTLIDEHIVGGMSYLIDPKLRTRPPETHARPKKEAVCADAARRLLECLDVAVDSVKEVRLKRVTIEVDLKEDR